MKAKIEVEKDENVNIAVRHTDGLIQELHITVEEAKDLYGKLGLLLSHEYANEMKKLFQKAEDEKESYGDQQILCDAIANQEIPAPKNDDIKIIQNAGHVTINM